MNRLKIFSLAMLVFTFFSCGGNEDVVEPEIEINNPEIASLVFPEANSECTEGTSITDTESTITFKWNVAQYANSYQLILKNLRSGTQENYSSTSTSLPVVLERGTPYSWSVISKSNKTSVTATSDTWKFYNAGSGVTSYTPFPADAISPENNSIVSGNTVSIDWEGSDVDNDINNYTVYFGESTPPELYMDNVNESIVENISVSSGKTYYWKIETKDDQQNTSTSDIFKFTVE